MKRLSWITLAVAVTVWQYRAGLARCGAVDGGVLLAPLVWVAVALFKGVKRDMQELFQEAKRSERACQQ